MDSGDLSLPVPALSGSATEPSALPAAQSYPSQARPLAGQPISAHQQTGENPFGAGRGGRGGGSGSGPVKNLRKRIGSVFAGLIALIAKFGVALKALLVALPNFKLLATSATALVSVAAYSLFWGWEFAAGFVLLLFLHEMGHVIALRREGIKASSPMFIPFLGAAIFAKSLGDNALAEARVGLAGPILGTLAAAAVAVVGGLTGSSFLLALAYVGFLINLFNLLPIVPLDGGRAMAAMAPWMWFLGFGALVALEFTYPNPILLIILLFGGMETWRRWQQRKTRSLEQAAYYRVSPRNRVLVGTVYIGLIVGLAFGMHETHILTSGGHNFGSI
jgi:Zn-dependent protease